MRFALGGISCECNGFAAGETETEYFKQTGFLLAGEAMLSLRSTSAEIGGAIDLLTKANSEMESSKSSGGRQVQDTIEIVPLLGARANSAAPLSNTCWDELRTGLLQRLETARDSAPLDGVLLAMHGNMCVGNVPGEPVDLDPEGTLAADVRRLVGHECCVVMTVDLHANITPLMVEELDACISYDHYPHDDIFRTGQRAAWLMIRAARGDVKPVLVASKINMMQTAMMATTIIQSDGSCGAGGELLLLAKRSEQQEGWSQPFLDPWENEWFVGSRHYGNDIQPTDGASAGAELYQAVLTTSMNFVHPHNDFPDMGNAAVVCVDALHPIISDRADSGDSSYDAAVLVGTAVADRLAMGFWEKREKFAVEAYTVKEAVAKGREMDGVVLLLELADCAGGGAAADSSTLVRELLACRTGGTEDEMCLSMCVDPISAAACVAAGEGATVDLALGHRVDTKWGEGPLAVSGKVAKVTETGRFTYSGGPFGGTEAAMGPSAVVIVGGNIHVLVMSRATYDWADEQYLSMDLDPAQAKFVGVKNPMNFRLGYAKYTDPERNNIPLKTPGPTSQMIGDLPYSRLQRPVWFPDRHDGVTSPTIRHFASRERAGFPENVMNEVVAEPAAGSLFGSNRNRNARL